MNAAPIDIPPSLLSYVAARSMPDFHRSLFPRERKKGGERKRKNREIFQGRRGEEERSKFPRRGSLPRG